VIESILGDLGQARTFLRSLDKLAELEPDAIPWFDEAQEDTAETDTAQDDT